jgi:hypothetical protein
MVGFFFLYFAPNPKKKKQKPFLSSGWLSSYNQGYNIFTFDTGQDVRMV